MAALGVLSTKNVQWDGIHFSFSKVRYGATGDTLTVPTGAESVAALVAAGDTAPTSSVSAGATGDTVTLTSGTTGRDVWVVTRHAGSPAGLGAR